LSGQIDSLPHTTFGIRASGTVWNHGPWRSQNEQASPTTPAFGHPSSPRRGLLFRACSFFLASFPSAGFPSAAILRQSTLPLLGEQAWPKAGVVGDEPKLNHYRKSRQTEQGVSVALPKFLGERLQRAVLPPAQPPNEAGMSLMGKGLENYLANSIGSPSLGLLLSLCSLQTKPECC
jgi:hypothetical protein